MLARNQTESDLRQAEMRRRCRKNLPKREGERERNEGEKKRSRDSSLSRVSTSITFAGLTRRERPFLDNDDSDDDDEGTALSFPTLPSVLSIPSDHEDAEGCWPGTGKAVTSATYDGRVRVHTTRRGCVNDEFPRVISMRLIFSE